MNFALGCDIHIAPPAVASTHRYPLKQTKVLWQPDEQRRKATAMYRFMRARSCSSYDELYRWSIDRLADYWQAHAGFCDVKFHKAASAVLDQPGDMTTARWFVGAELNFAEHLLRHSGNRPAIIFRGENGMRRELSFDELRRDVASLATALKSEGVNEGDRVAGFLPNCPEAIIAMLATASIGAVWSSCSPDFGINGVVDRFGQIEPKVLFCADGYFYNGKRCDSLAAVRGVVAVIKSVQRTVVVPFTGDQLNLDGLPHALSWRDFRGGEAELNVCVRAVCPSALRHVFLRYDRCAEMHRARSRRHSAAAPEGARPALRRGNRRPPVLLHHLRLDDVELAGQRAGCRCDADSVRRIAFP